MSYKGFQIVCLGTYCLPRVIATICHFKATKALGEKSCPFDLAFCWDFNAILKTLDNEFTTFFDGIEYDYLKESNAKSEIRNIFGSKLDAKFWKNDTDGFIFNHEDGFTFEEFKTRYTNRINNFYQYIKNLEKEVYFVIASFNPIEQTQIDKLNNIIKRYRNDGFYNIILNQSENTLSINSNNTFVIDCSKYNELFKGDWGLMLKEHYKYNTADNMYKEIDYNLKKIILRI